MTNPYQIRKEKNLYYVLSESISAYDFSGRKRRDTVIVMHLYYLDTLERYQKYIAEVPYEIDVIVVSSNEKLLTKTEEYIEQNSLKNVKVIKKENRGRDISAFLVACRKEILKYRYFCFVHDKKSGQKEIDHDMDFWITNLWDNTVKTKEYIGNVIQLLEDKDELGLLVPPEPIGEYRAHWFYNSWEGNYEYTEKLARKLKLCCEMSPEIPVITLGTVFWCKTEALKKLLEIDWKYADFDAEPLPYGRTLSHAVERIFSFVVQDAGYETGTAMCNSYAEKLINFLQGSMGDIFNRYNEISDVPVCNINEVKRSDIRKEKLNAFCQQNEKIYLYGAGKVGKRCKKYLEAIHQKTEGFLVSQKGDTVELEGIPVLSLQELEKHEKTGIIITVDKRLHGEVEEMLIKEGFQNYISFIYL